MSIQAIQDLDPIYREVSQREERIKKRLCRALNEEIKVFEKEGAKKLRTLKAVSAFLAIAAMVSMLGLSIVSSYYAFVWAPWVGAGVSFVLMAIKVFALEPRIESLEKTAIASKVYLEMVPKERVGCLHPIGETDLSSIDIASTSAKKMFEKGGNSRANADFLRIEGSARNTESQASVIGVDAPLPLRAAASLRYAKIEDRVLLQWKDVRAAKLKNEREGLKVRNQFLKKFEAYEKRVKQQISEFEKKNNDSSLRDKFNELQKLEYDLERLEFISRAHSNCCSMLKALEVEEKRLQTENLPIDPQIAAEKSKILDERAKIEKELQREDVDLSQLKNSENQLAQELLAIDKKRGRKLLKELAAFFKAREMFIPNYLKASEEAYIKNHTLFTHQLAHSSHPLDALEEGVKNELTTLIREFNDANTAKPINVAENVTLREAFELLNNRKNEMFPPLKDKVNLLQRGIEQLYKVQSDSALSVAHGASRVLRNPFKFSNDEEAKLKDDLIHLIHEHNKNYPQAEIHVPEQVKLSEIIEIIKSSKLSSDLENKIIAHLPSFSNDQKIYWVERLISLYEHLKQQNEELKALEEERQELYKASPCLSWSHFHVETLESVQSALKHDISYFKNFISEYRLNPTTTEFLIDAKFDEANTLLYQLNLAASEAKLLKKDIHLAIVNHPQTFFTHVGKQLEEANKLLASRASKLEELKTENEKADNKSDLYKKSCELEAEERKGIAHATERLKKAQSSYEALKVRYQNIKDKVGNKQLEKEVKSITKKLSQLDENLLKPILRDLKRPFNSHVSRFVNHLMNKGASRVDDVGVADSFLKRNIVNMNHVLLKTDKKHRLMERLTNMIPIIIVVALSALDVAVTFPGINLVLCGGFFMVMAFRLGASHYLKTIRIERLKQKMQRLLVNVPNVVEIPGHRSEALHHLESRSDRLGLEGISMTESAMIMDGEVKFGKGTKFFDKSSLNIKPAMRLFARNVKKYNNPKFIQKLSANADAKKPGAQARLKIQRKYAQADVKARVGQTLDKHWDHLSLSLGAPSDRFIKDKQNLSSYVELHTGSLPPLKTKENEILSDEQQIKLQKKHDALQTAQNAYVKAKKKWERILNKPLPEDELDRATKVTNKSAKVEAARQNMVNCRNKWEELSKATRLKQFESFPEKPTHLSEIAPHFNFNQNKVNWAASDIYKSNVVDNDGKVDQTLFKSEVDRNLSHLEAVKNNKELQSAKKEFLTAKKEYDAILDEEPTNKDQRREKIYRIREAEERVRDLRDKFEELSQALRK